MKKRVFVFLLAVSMLFGLLTACGEVSAPVSSAPAGESSAKPTEIPDAPAASADPMETPDAPTFSADPTETPVAPEEPEIDPADHIFPDPEVFFGREADENHSNDARGWKYSFQKLRPYDRLEAAKAELLALLQEPRWQL